MELVSIFIKLNSVRGNLIYYTSCVFIKFIPLNRARQIQAEAGTHAERDEMPFKKTVVTKNGETRANPRGAGYPSHKVGVGFMGVEIFLAR